MTQDMLTGRLVRLAAEEPETLAKAFHRWGQDSVYMRMLDSSTKAMFSEKKWKEGFEKDQQRGAVEEFFFSIRSLADDNLIGFMGLFDIAWQHGDALVAIGIGEAQYWSKGYGTDAMQVMLAFAFNEMNLRRLTLIVFEHNPRGIRSYQKSGFVIEGRQPQVMQRDGRRWDWLWMGILREEWQLRQGT